MSDIEQRLREGIGRSGISGGICADDCDAANRLMDEAADTIVSLRRVLNEESRAAGTWEDGHRELLDAVMACCDPENRVCGLMPGPERDALEEVISRHHTVHSAKGPYIDAALATKPAVKDDETVVEALDASGAIDAVAKAVAELQRRVDAGEYVIATLITNLKTGNCPPEKAVEWFEAEGRAALAAKDGRS